MLSRFVYEKADMWNNAKIIIYSEEYMKITVLSLGVLSLLLLGAREAHAAIYIEYEPIKGETTKMTSGETVVAAVVGKSFVLDGSKSIDDGVVGKFLWKQVSGPTVRISNATTLTASVVPQSAGTYVFELTVTDSTTGRTSSVKRVEVSVSTAPTVEVIKVPAVETQTVAPPPTKPQEASGDVFMKIDTIEGESSEPKKGNVEMEWKVEEGESAAPKGTADYLDDDSDDDGVPITPDFSILLGGGGSDDDKAEEEKRGKVADILLQGAQEQGAPVESVSLNFEKIKTKVKQPVKLLGLIPVSARATVEIDANGKADVSFPWWAVFASGKERSEVAEQTLQTISNVLKTRHDALKSVLNTIR